jgi:hypothetical protein
MGGALNCRSLEMEGVGASVKSALGTRVIESTLAQKQQRAVVTFAEAVKIGSGEELRVEVHG